jgi:Spy/CpxP family protein refolding chaperone
MNRKRSTTIAAFTLAVLGLAALSLAAAQETKPRDPFAGRLERLSRVLDLTADQTANAQPLADALKARLEPFHDSARQQRKALHDLLEAPAPDARQVGQAVMALRQTREQARAAFEEFDRGFSALLTPEQKTRYATIKERHGPGHRGHERGHDRGWGKGSRR